MKAYRKSDYFGYVWMLPALILICVFCIYPAGSALVHSFTNWPMANEAGGATSAVTTWAGLDNFIRLFKDNIFWKSCVNLIILLITGMIFGNVSALGLAEMLHKVKNRTSSNVYRFLFVIPMLVPGIVNMLVWTEIVFRGTASGLINTILANFNVPPQGWYKQENQALLSMILTGFPWVSGTSFLIYLAGLNNIPESVYEALDLDGAGTWKRIFYIDLPLLKSQIKYFVMMGIIGGMQSFNMQLVVTSGGPNHATDVPGYYMYQKAFFSGEWGYASAIGFFLFIVTLIITVINNKFMKSTEEIA